MAHDSRDPDALRRPGWVKEETTCIIRMRVGDETNGIGFYVDEGERLRFVHVEDGDLFRVARQYFPPAKAGAEPYWRFVLKPIIRGDYNPGGTMMLMEMEAVPLVAPPPSSVRPQELLKMTVTAWLQDQQWTEETRPDFHEVVVRLCRRDLGITKPTAERILTTIEGFGRRSVGRRRKIRNPTEPSKF